MDERIEKNYSLGVIVAAVTFNILNNESTYSFGAIFSNHDDLIIQVLVPKLGLEILGGLTDYLDFGGLTTHRSER